MELTMKTLPVRRYAKFILFSLFACFFASNSSHATTNLPLDPFKLYSKNIKFDVFRNNKKVGNHNITFYHLNDDKFKVIAEMDLSVRFLSIPLYSYSYRSEATWQQNKLTDLTSEQNDDGITTNVNVISAEKSLLIKGPSGNITADRHLYPTNHWHAGVLSQKQVINTLNGKVANVKIAEIESEQILAEGKTISANRYQYSGDVETTVWYDNAGRWVKMQFNGKGGSVIDYRCIECGITKGMQKGG